MWIRQIRIGLRSALAFSTLGLLLVLLGLIALYQMNRMDDMSAEVDTNWLPSIMAVNDMSAASSRIRAMTLRYAIVQGDFRGTTLTSLQKAESALETAERRYEPMIASPDERRLYDAYKVARDRYMEQSRLTVSQTQAGNSEEARHTVEQKLGDYAEQLANALGELARINSEGAKRASAASDATFDNAVTLVIVVIAIAVVLTILLAVIFTRSIILPLAQAVDVARVVASGNLTHRIEAQGQDEPAHLLRSLQEMQTSLRSTIQHIADSSSQLASASEELHAVTEDSTRGLHQQNTEIEQAATAVNEMTTAVEEVARNAVSTSEASKQADHTARSGREQVGQAVNSIAQLAGDVANTSSKVEELADNVRDISQVLAVIRSIAEQTNLLALNAAIEAARAGEQGRGFAVVADEVRALAHRTQQSTQEIEQMINTIQQGTSQAVTSMQSSRERVDFTLEVARAAGAALDEIALAISSINERNLVIASASEEQAHVAREVDRNLVNIRDLSLQTSAGADQTSAASQELSRLAIDLNGVVQRFQL
ncbi:MULTISPECIES: methyl-accepting chemotaxis protein [Pseudomonadaceae]|uniref:methyl-accepting chemotaxis protein n=1 Tax=Pseudomonadaceae TaxID=135621 RepID=UPI0005CB1985|nr:MULTISPECIES: methyl-accepting chemotaxis protein [Pseudomonas]KIV74780.1 Methyl-accepting chemotaxis protein I (serine chemoreceptor protein) [Pseudomonas sp. FeS53a]MDU9398611.1 methyl-accepting chemotaxis protein [Pseudomonas sp. zfem003]QZX81190.1 methyl-accepting chemotaxis protein [Pseudomonas otitidis]